jgi:hypothetical protein
MSDSKSLVKFLLFVIGNALILSWSAPSLIAEEGTYIIARQTYAEPVGVHKEKEMFSPDNILISQEDSSTSKHQMATTEEKPLGSVYLDMTISYGYLNSPQPEALGSPIGSLIGTILSTTIKQGGVSYRGYAGFLANITERISLGVEGGFSYYSSSQYQFQIDSHTIDFSELGIFDNLSGVSPAFFGKLRQHGYGVDFLSNFTFYCIPELYLSFKPGIQLAYQSNRVHVGLDANAFTDVLDFSTKFSSLALLPEVILACGWNIQVTKHWIITTEINYQHVFGRDFCAVGKMINSRNMIGFSIGFKY